MRATDVQVGCGLGVLSPDARAPNQRNSGHNAYLRRNSDRRCAAPKGEREVTILTMTVLVALGSFAAGLLGSLTGIGGGIIIVPMLTLLFHVDLRYAIGASLVSVIATSSGAAAAYVREGYTNVRVGMLLDVATTSGA